MSMCYVGRCKCRNVVAACATDSIDISKKEVAKFVAGFIKDGLTVEQMDTENVRVVLQKCVCQPELEKR